MGHENGLVTINVTGTDAGVLAGARDRFGNRRANYGEALRRHYADDPPEGWAHTVPHLMPLTDLADHAEAAGLAMHEEPPSDWDTYTGAGGTRLVQIAGCLGMAFDHVSPSVVLDDPCPFVPHGTVREKLAFVHVRLSASPLKSTRATPS